jgi:guanylate kinase
VTGKVVIFAAPSGAGKSTISRYVLSANPSLAFSVSATTRPPRNYETDGEHYHFMDVPTFKEKIEAGEFVEWQEVYSGHFYGTLHTEVAKIWNAGKHVVFDVDVRGAVNLKHIYKEGALAVFVMPPSIAILDKRLRSRGTDGESAIRMRLEKAFYELSYFAEFDSLILNDSLDKACFQTAETVKKFLETHT